MMMQNKDQHEKIIDFLIEEISIEEGIIQIGRGVREKGYPYIPDIIAKKSNGKFLVVEVGSTQWEKIEAYKFDPKICEIRWYSKRGTLIGEQKDYPVVENKEVIFPEIKGKQFGTVKIDYEVQLKEIKEKSAPIHKNEKEKLTPELLLFIDRKTKKYFDALWKNRKHLITKERSVDGNL